MESLTLNLDAATTRAYTPAPEVPTCSRRGETITDATAPGLVIAGVDDLTARRQMGTRDGFPERALRDRPSGAAICLSHSPSEVERAAELGADLMLSGHTHNGQIWPFAHLVKLAYPRLTGVHEVGGMTLVVSRGTGFWGPPMRLFRRSEIVRITLRKA